MLALSAFASLPRELPPRGGVIDTKAECADEHESCAEWAKAGECKSNRGFMTRQCALSCDRCDQYAPPMPRYDDAFEAIDTDGDSPCQQAGPLTWRGQGAFSARPGLQ